MNIGTYTEDDGIVCSFDIEEAPYMSVTIQHPGGRKLSERFIWEYEPRWGVDISDSQKADEITNKLLKQMRDI